MCVSKQLTLWEEGNELQRISTRKSNSVSVKSSGFGMIFMGVEKAHVHWWGICKPDEYISEHLCGILSNNMQWLQRIEILSWCSANFCWPTGPCHGQLNCSRCWTGFTHPNSCTGSQIVHHKCSWRCQALWQLLLLQNHMKMLTRELFTGLCSC